MDTGLWLELWQATVFFALFVVPIAMVTMVLPQCLWTLGTRGWHTFGAAMPLEVVRW